MGSFLGNAPVESVWGGLEQGPCRSKGGPPTGSDSRRTPSVSRACRGPPKGLLLEDKEQVSGRAKSRGSQARRCR